MPVNLLNARPGKTWRNKRKHRSSPLKYLVNTNQNISVEDSTFEGGTVGSWIPQGTVPPTLSNSSTVSHTPNGTKSLKITWNGVGAFDGPQFTFKNVPVGVPRTIYVWVYVPTGNSPVQLITAGFGFGDGSTVLDKWQLLTQTIIPTTDSVTISVSPNAEGAGQFFYLDDVTIGAPPSKYAYEVMTDAPILYYRMNEPSGTTVTDFTGNGRNGTYTSCTLGATGLVPSTLDKAVSFNGTTSRTLTTYAPWMDVSLITLEVVANPTTVAGVQSLLDRDSTGAAPRVFQFRINAGKLEAIFWDTGGSLTTVTGTTTLVAGTTYHLAASWDGTTVRLYVNYLEDVATAKSGTLQTGSRDFGIGANATAFAFFSGTIDEVAIYGAALSQTRIAMHYLAMSAALLSEVSATGSITLGGSATAKAPITASGSITLGGSATAVGAATATGSITLGGTANAAGDTNATGSITLDGSATAAVGGTNASGSITLSGSATAVGAATATGSVTLGGSVSAAAPITASGAITLSGSATARAPITATGSITLSGTATARGAATATGTITLSGSATLSVPATASGSITLAGTATATGSTPGLWVEAIVNASTWGQNTVGSNTYSEQSVSAPSYSEVTKTVNPWIEYTVSPNTWS